MTVAILRGGRGTRLQEHTPEVPKPLVESAAPDPLARETCWPEGVEVRCTDTGVDTPTGGRLWRVREENDLWAGGKAWTARIRQPS